jgi:hypothetical protein
MIQTMELADQDKFDFDPLDVTKIWPENLFPLQPVSARAAMRGWFMWDRLDNTAGMIVCCPSCLQLADHQPNHSGWAGAASGTTSPARPQGIRKPTSPHSPPTAHAPCLPVSTA